MCASLNVPRSFERYLSDFGPAFHAGSGNAHSIIIFATEQQATCARSVGEFDMSGQHAPRLTLRNASAENKSILKSEVCDAIQDAGVTAGEASKLDSCEMFSLSRPSEKSAGNTLVHTYLHAKRLCLNRCVYDRCHTRMTTNPVHIYLTMYRYRLDLTSDRWTSDYPNPNRVTFVY
jgi:hypothetical protein